MKANRIIAGCTVVLAALYFWGIYSIRVPRVEDALGPRSFPIMIGIGLIIAALMLLLESRRAVPAPADDDAVEPQTHNYKTVLLVVVATAVYFFAFEPVGYVLSTVVFLSALILHFYKGSRVTALATSIGFSLVTYFLFTKLLRAALPSGLLPF